MKRTPLKRKTPLRRTRFSFVGKLEAPRSPNARLADPRSRKARKVSKYRARERDTDRMLWTKMQPCIVRMYLVYLDLTNRVANREVSTVDREAFTRFPCSGSIEADHAGRRGLGRKAPDDTVIPICQQHHDHRQTFHGFFKTWDKVTMRAFLTWAIGYTQRGYDDRLRALLEAVDLTERA